MSTEPCHIDLSKLLDVDLPDIIDPPRHKPTLKSWCFLITGTLTAPIWLPLVLLWFVLRLGSEAIQDQIFRIRNREEFAKMPKAQPEPRYCMRVVGADGTEMHFQLTKQPKRAWIKETQGGVGQSH